MRLRTFAVALAALTMTGSISEEELECEHAFVHLQDCCPDLHSLDVCGEGCVSRRLTVEESRCIRDLECDAILAANICQRVSNVPDEETPSEVCP